MAEESSTTFSEVSGVEVSEIQWLQSPGGTSDKRATIPNSVVNKGETLTTAVTNSFNSLKVITDEFSSAPFKPSQLSSSQVTTNQLWSLSPIVNVWANQLTIPHITTDEVSRQIVALQDGTLQVDVAKISTAQVKRSQIDPTQVNSMQDNISEISFPISITLEQLLGIKNFGGVGFNSSIWHNSVAENSLFRGSDTSQIGIPQVTTNQFSFPQISTTEVSTSQVSTNQISIPKTGLSEIGINQVTVNQRSRESSPLQIGTTKTGINQVDGLEARFFQINTTEINIHETSVVNTDFSQISTNKISLPSLITLDNLFPQSIQSENFFKFIHKTPHTSNNTYQDNPLNLFDPTFNLTLQITNLPKGQLAEAQITTYDPQGRPNSGTILIDTDANGIGWFIDPTPNDNSEYTTTTD